MQQPLHYPALPTAADVDAAAQRLAGIALRTPLVTSPVLDALTGAVADGVGHDSLVFGDARGLPLILFPTSFGRHSQNKDFGLIDACVPFIDSGKITIYCPDSADLEGFITRKSTRLIACGRTIPTSA
jgi:hypothetical protein